MSKKSYEKRSDVDKIQSQWHKLTGLHSWGKWSAARKLETREATHEQREKKKATAEKVVPLVPPGKAQGQKKAGSK
jgi:hypothetical protein